EENTSDVVPSNDSERVQVPSFQQSETITRRKILEGGLGARKSQCKPKNNDITGEMRFTFHDGNSNPQNDHVLSSGHSYHDCTRRSQNEVEHQQPESTCVIPFSPEEDITDVLIKGPPIKDRISRRQSPEVLIVGETMGSRPLPHTQDMELVRAYHHVLPGTQSHLKVDESFLGSNGHIGLQLGDNLSISDLQRTSSPTIEHISPKNTDHNSQSISVTPSKFVPVETNQEENRNTSSCPNQTGIENSEIISVDQTANTSLDFTRPASPFGLSGYIQTVVYEILDDNWISIQLEDFDSPSSDNDRRLHSGESEISSSVSSSNSSSTHNSITNSLPWSNLRFNQHILPTPVASDNTIVNNINSSASSQNEDTNDLNILPHPLYEARQRRRVTTPEFSADSDSWPSMPHFTILNNVRNYHPKGLTKQQINSLPVRDFCKYDKLNQCSICITRYKQGSKIRILPCAHEYHHKCIDRWLSDNSTCPICRLHIINPDNTEILI
ncbi:E3 ubiquitin-protein ligase RLIM-like, partial [Psammomys obesus]|uniref:E3 ubiquitin-protein ligase RLIM-like n=1 Tax=Psammomys obesus TaxID=48139 RepID=UPI0024535641